MALTFPSSPTLNQAYTYNGTTYTWNGSTWTSRRKKLIAPQSFNINIPPSTPHAMDDEFDAASLNTTKWKDQNGNNPTTWTLRESCLTATVNGGGGIILQNITDSSWKFRMAWCLPQWFTGTSQVISFTAYRNANQRSIDYGLWSDGSNQRRPTANNFFNNYGAWSSQTYTGGFDNDAGPYVYLMNYWEFQSNGTTLTWRWSNTGYDNSWRDIHAINWSSWLGAVPDKVGLWISGVPVGLIDWFRRIS